MKRALFLGLSICGMGLTPACASKPDHPPPTLGSQTAPSDPVTAAIPAAIPSITDAGGVPDAPPPLAPIETRIAALPHVKSVTEYVDAPDAPRKSVPAGYRRFDVAFEQPADHTAPSGTFLQRLSVLHKEDGAPTVLSTSGYMLFPGASELTRLYAANQIEVEHRFFESSTPASRDWSLDTIAQSAADFHAITASFKTLYPGKWISTGASKGGETVVFHRRFFPNDVDGTVAYVAPIAFGLQDRRFISYIDAIGGTALDACRAKIRAFQKAVLAQRDAIKPLATGPFTRIGGVDVALEHGVIEVLFSFFQYGDPGNPDVGCDAIPAADAPAETLFAYLDGMGALDGNVDDASLEAFGPYFAQAGLELGNYAMDLAPLGGSLLHPETYTIAPYLPEGFALPFRPESMLDVAAWVKNEAKNILFIYGENDPWSAAAYETSELRDTKRIFVAGANHGARFSRMTDAQRAAGFEMIDRWLDRSVAALPKVTRALAPEKAPRVSPDDARGNWRLRARRARQ